MKKEEIENVLDKIAVVKDCFDKFADGEYSINNKTALELILKLEEMKYK